MYVYEGQRERERDLQGRAIILTLNFLTVKIEAWRHYSNIICVFREYKL